MDIERLATSAIITSLSKTERLSSFVNSGDKEPCWDGNIYIHESKDYAKRNIRKVAVQVKGKLVDNQEPAETIKYAISYDDLKANLMNGGGIFFVVYLDRSTGDAIQIYYDALLPIKVKEILQKEQKTYTNTFQRFPQENEKKLELFLNFHENASRQVSFVGKDLPTITELEEQGLLESITFNYIGVGKEFNQFTIPQHLNGKSLTIYANVKGGTIPVPVQYFDSISNIAIGKEVCGKVSVNGEEFYDRYALITTADHFIIRVGTCVKLIFPNVEEAKGTVPVQIKIKIEGTLRERILGMEFVAAIRKHGSMSIGDATYHVMIPDGEHAENYIREYGEQINSYKEVQKLFDSMSIKKDLELDRCTDEDIERLNFLKGTVGDKLLVREVSRDNLPLQILTISNLKIAVLYTPNKNGGYSVWDYFGNRFKFVIQEEGKEEIRISQFSTMQANDYLELDNLNLKTILDDYKNIEPHDNLYSEGTNTLLEMLKAYDMQPSSELFETVKEMMAWLASLPEGDSKEITTLNSLQIARRERALSYREKLSLYAIVEKSEEITHKIGALLLLDEQEEAKKLLATLALEQKNTFESFPIYQRFCNA